jgi:glycosyltransferase A (GT-A) superfamily protein (DUF2064 family)
LQTSASHTALLLFTRTPEEEVRQKTLWPNLGRRKAASVFVRLVRRAKAIARESGLPCFVVTSSEQEGSGFGERFYHALSSVFARGFGSVIAIGNDCPQLTAREIETARGHLQRGQAVLGPATDGGVYLLGVSAEQLADRQAFLAVRWNSARVQTELGQLLREQGAQVALLRPLTDLDDAASLRAAFTRRQLQPELYRYLQSILASLKAARPENLAGRLVSAFFSHALSFRGPPTFPHFLF